MGRKFRFTVLALLMALSFCSCKKEAVRTEEEIIETLIEPTVMITVGEKHATGVLVEKNEEKVTLFSVAHLMEGYDQGIVSFADGNVAFADVVYINSQNDICILEIESKYLSKDFYDSLKCAAIDTEKTKLLQADEEVILVGSAISPASNITKGTFKVRDYYVPEFDQYLIYLYGDASHGMSGSGCYTSQGILFGLVTAGSETGEVVCIPIEDYIEEWRN